MIRKTRPVSWMRSAEKAFRKFPREVQERGLRALNLAAEGQKADIAKPMKGLGSGVFEIALAYRSDAYRTVYAVQLADEIWVIHAFQKKSRAGIKTPKQEIDLIRDRLRQLKEILR